MSSVVKCNLSITAMLGQAKIWSLYTGGRYIEGWEHSLQYDHRMEISYKKWLQAIKNASLPPSVLNRVPEIA